MGEVSGDREEARAWLRSSIGRRYATYLEKCFTNANHSGMLQNMALEEGRHEYSKCQGIIRILKILLNEEKMLDILEKQEDQRGT